MLSMLSCFFLNLLILTAVASDDLTSIDQTEPELQADDDSEVIRRALRGIDHAEPELQADDDPEVLRSLRALRGIDHAEPELQAMSEDDNQDASQKSASLYQPELLAELQAVSEDDDQKANSDISFSQNSSARRLCHLTPCEAPTGIANALSSSCYEGQWVNVGSNCTPACAYGYSPSVWIGETWMRTSSLICETWKCCYEDNCLKLPQFSPPTFACRPSTCSAPRGVENGASPSCAEGSTRIGDCTPACDTGYSPSLSSLSCSEGYLSPPTFSCSPSNCTAPTDVANALSPSCSEGSIINHSNKCTFACAPGHAASYSTLTCRFGLLRVGGKTPESSVCAGPGCLGGTHHEEHSHTEVLSQAPSGIHSEDDRLASSHTHHSPLAGSDAGVQWEAFLGYSPGNFSCNPIPCSAPQLANALNPSCSEGRRVEHGSSCTLACQAGFNPSVPSLSCSLGKISPGSCEPEPYDFIPILTGVLIALILCCCFYWCCMRKTGEIYTPPVKVAEVTSIEPYQGPRPSSAEPPPPPPPEKKPYDGPNRGKIQTARLSHLEGPPPRRMASSHETLFLVEATVLGEHGLEPDFDSQITGA